MLLAAVALALIGACSSDTSVGDKSLLEGKGGQGGGALRPTTTTTAKPTTTVAKGPTTTAKGATTTTAKRAPSITIVIQADTKGAPFVPSVAQVRRASTVRWHNTDTVARSVVFDDESLDSGPIRSGADFDWVADRVGTINYHDGTRPYAVASIQVV